MSNREDGIIRWSTCKKHKYDYISNCLRCEEEKQREIYNSIKSVMEDEYYKFINFEKWKRME